MPWDFDLSSKRLLPVHLSAILCVAGSFKSSRGWRLRQLLQRQQRLPRWQ
jgi:hypothetical protein